MSISNLEIVGTRVYRLFWKLTFHVRYFCIFETLELLSLGTFRFEALEFGNCEIWSFEALEFLNTDHIYSNNSLINRLLMVTGSWLMAQGSWLIPQDSWLKAKNKLALGPGALGNQRQNFLGLGPRASRHEPWAMSHKPLAIHNRWINELFNYILQVLATRHYPSTYQLPPLRR